MKCWLPEALRVLTVRMAAFSESNVHVLSAPSHTSQTIAQFQNRQVQPGEQSL